MHRAIMPPATISKSKGEHILSDVFDPDTDPAPTQEYTPLPDPAAVEDKGKVYDNNDSGSLREAAKDLDNARAAGTIPRAEDVEPIDRSYRHDAGLGEPLEPHFTLEPRQAANDLERVRAAEVANAQAAPDAVAAAVDAFRNQLSADPQAQPEAQPQQQTEFNPQAQAQQTTEAQPQQPHDGLDPEIAQALANPKIRAALESEVKAADDARAAFALAARQAAQVGMAAVLADSDLASLPPEQWAHALNAIAKVDPESCGRHRGQTQSGTGPLQCVKASRGRTATTPAAEPRGLDESRKR